jgi:hypothetical protein
MEEPDDQETPEAAEEAAEESTEVVDEAPAEDETTSGDAPGADEEWTSTGEHIRNLGATVKGHYDQPSDGDPGPSGDELRDAASQFGKAVGRLFGALGDAARDPEVKEQAQRAGSSMLAALGKTFDQLGDEATDAFNKAKTKADDANDGAEDVMESAKRELDDEDLLDELKADLAEDEGEPTG